MKSFAVSLSILLQLLAVPGAAVQSGKASVEGIVVSKPDNTPVRGARVTLKIDREGSSRTIVNVNGLAGEPEMDTPGLSATTDEQGKFAISEINSGVSYRLTIVANGYVRQENVRLFPGTRQVIALTPTGSIEGIVRAESGEPLQDVRVRLMRYVFTVDGRRQMKLVASTTTNDLGKYRLYYLTPGRYYLHAERIGVHADFSRRSVTPVGPSFYPGVPDIAHASVIDIQPGMNRSGSDFTLSGERLYRIRGQIVDGTGRALKGRTELLSLFDLGPYALPGGDIGSFGGGLLKSTYSEDTGEFEFQDVPPGTYGIAGDSLDAGKGGGLKIVRVDSDLVNVALAFGSGVEISGTLRADGRIDLSNVQIAIRLALSVDDGTDESSLEDAAGLSPDFENISDRSFKIRNIYPGEYRIDFRDSDLPEDSYIKEARYGGIDALTQPFQVQLSDSRKLEIVLGVSGTIEGRIVNDRMIPVEGVTAVLIPNRLRTRPDLFKKAVADKDGRFVLRGIAPGDYRLFAWDGLEPYSWFDPEVVRPFEARGVAVHISESSKQSIEVKVIPIP